MEQEILQLQKLSEDYQGLLSRLANAPASGESIDILNRELIRIEGQIDSSTDTLYSWIRKDDSIPTENRSEQLANTLSQLGINLEEFRIRRRTTLNAAEIEMKKSKEEIMRNKRKELLGTNSSTEISQSLKQQDMNSTALAKDITSRLERTYAQISDQVKVSENSLVLMDNATFALQGINDATTRAQIAQSHATQSLIKLRIAQNWDRYLYNFSKIVFILAVVYVIYSKITNNLISKSVWFLLKQIFRLAQKPFEYFRNSKGENVNPSISDTTL